jgi:hypothetical protein
MKDIKPKHETPALSRAGRKIADATLAAAKFKPTVDGKRMVRLDNGSQLLVKVASVQSTDERFVWSSCVFCRLPNRQRVAHLPACGV